MRWFRQEWRAVLVILASVLVFFPEILLLTRGFLSGDHRQQHFPWFSFYWEQLRNFSLPWWTTYNQCGFPLLAEGQIGAFYPINFLAVLLLPLKAAYNYSVLIHFLLGGLFFFAYCRKIGLDRIAGIWATLIFLFGSCQGGFFYNITSQRVLIWFPLTLLLSHRILERGKWVDALTLGIVLALQSVAGYQQYAAYSFGFTALYFFLMWCREKREKVQGIVLFCAAVLFSFLVALPQWIPFLELTRFSSRQGVTQEFAFIGSMNPLGPATLFFPGWQGILGTEFYVGIVGLFFSLFALGYGRNKFVRTHLFLLVVALLLAWGRFSPLYIGLIKLTHFYGFRTPVKLVFFAGFSLSVLSGWGLHLLRGHEFDQAALRVKKAVNAYGALLGGLSLAVLAAACALRIGREWVLSTLETIVRKEIIGKPFRMSPPEVYLSRVEPFYELLLKNVSWANPWLLGSLGLFCLSLLVLLGLSRQKRPLSGKMLFLLLGVLYADLFGYSFRNIRTDLEKFSFVEQKSEIVRYLERDSSLFRLYVFNRDLPSEEVPLMSNSNLAARIQNVGIYSPLAWRRYKDFLGELGDVDDSIYRRIPNEESVSENLQSLSFMNVKYVLASRALEIPRLKKVVTDGRFELYENRDALPRFLFIEEKDYEPNSLGRVVEHATPARYEGLKYDQNGISLDLEIKSPGFLVTSESSYPGWTAKVDGAVQPLETFLGLFRVLRLDPGKHHVAMVYQPSYGPLCWATSAVCLLFYGGALLRQKMLHPFTAAEATASSRGRTAVPARGTMPRAGGGEAKQSRPLTRAFRFLKAV